MTQVSLFDEDVVAAEERHPSVVYDHCNRVQGHLLIASGGQDYVFINNGGGVITFGHFAGPSHDLSPAQLRVIGDYCHRAANRIEDGYGQAV
jgi:hypothetical protein